MVELTYDFWACESRSAVTKPDLNSSSIAGVGILSGHVRLAFLNVGDSSEWASGSEPRWRVFGEWGEPPLPGHPC
jgi:hypothetical protein